MAIGEVSLGTRQFYVANRADTPSSFVANCFVRAAFAIDGTVHLDTFPIVNFSYSEATPDDKARTAAEIERYIGLPLVAATLFADDASPAPPKYSGGRPSRMTRKVKTFVYERKGSERVVVPLVALAEYGDTVTHIGLTPTSLHNCAMVYPPFAVGEMLPEEGVIIEKRGGGWPLACVVAEPDERRYYSG